MAFQKGNTAGVRFGKDSQPSGEAKSKGKARAKLMRETMKELLQSIEPDDAAAASVMTYLPKKDRKKITTQDVLCLRQILEAKRGNHQAFNNVMKLLGESTENVELTGKDGKDLYTKYEVEIIDSRSQVDRPDEDTEE